MPVNTIFRTLAVTVLITISSGASAHGSVVADGDLCLIEFGFYTAHFTIFQPQTRNHREFCEDIPDVSESVFIMKYLHNSLREVPVDFRIIRDRENRGRFVTREEIEAIEDLQSETVYYQPPQIQQDGVFSIVHQFEQPGDYIGIVTARHPTKDLTYSAIFPFHVGDTSWGYWPWFIALALFAQLLNWLVKGGYARLRTKHKP